MKRAIATVFCNYTYSNPLYSRVLFEYFKKELKLWKGTFDILHLGDSNFGLTDEDRKYIEGLGIELHVEVLANGWSAGKNLTELVKNINEDHLLLIHPDTIIYDPFIIQKGFDLLNSYETVAIFDGSGKSLKEKFSIMAENKYRSERRRFCNYLWFQNNHWFKRVPDFDFEPVGKFGDYGEATSYVTEQLLEMGVRAHELRDDRSNITLANSPFTITKTQWLDSADKEWGRECPLRLGYYHIRNGNGGAELVNEYVNLRESFDRRKAIMPLSEMTRLLGWYQCLVEATGMNSHVSILPVVLELGVSHSDWGEYMSQFKNFHNYIFNV